VGTRRFDAAAFSATGRPVLLGHRTGEVEALVWTAKNGRVARLSRAPWLAAGIATEGEGVIVVGREGQTMALDDDGSRLGSVTDRRVSLALRGVTQLSTGAVVAFGLLGQMYRRGDGHWEPWSLPPPLPKSSGKLASGRGSERQAIAGVAGDPDATTWAFAIDGTAWSRSGKGWKMSTLPVQADWTCAASRPGGQPVVAGPGIVLVGAGAKWRTISVGELTPVAIAALDDALFVADGESVWRVDGKAPRLVLGEPVETLAMSKKGLLAASERAVYLSTDGSRWAQLA
jgi:hypothetical protein